MTSLETLEARLRKLEEDKISAERLDLRSVIKALERSWTPNAEQLIGPGSIKRSMLTSGLVPRITYGAGSDGWGGTNLLEPVVAHGLGVVPVFAVAVLRAGGSVYYNTHYVGISSWDATNFVPTWQLDSGTSAGTSNYAWMAMG